MRRTGLLKFSGMIFCVSIVSSASVRNERSVNFLSEKLDKDFLQRYSEQQLRLRRAVRETVTQSVQSQSKFKIGSCTFEDFLNAAKNCSATFYREIRTENHTRSQCKHTYEKLRSCMLSTLTGCIKSSSFDTGNIFAANAANVKENFLILLGDETFWCEKGGLGISSDYLPRSYSCDPVFYHVSEGCTATYRKIFKTDTTNRKLCSEYEKAKICYLETIFRHCSFDVTARRIIEIMIQITDDFQPFCKRPVEQEESTLERLIFSKSCPPYSLSDVAFALDITNGTNRKQYLAMKRMVEEVAKQMDYGSRGIQIAVFQYDTQVRNILKFGRPARKSVFQRLVRRMARATPRSKSKTQRMTGKALLSIGKNTFYAKEKGKLIKKPYKSGQRPHNPAILFVMATGRSSDSTSSGLQLLKERNVQVVYVGQVPQQPRKVVGPHLILSGPLPANGFDKLSAPKTISTDFMLREVGNTVGKMTQEICNADRLTQSPSSAVLQEGVVSNSRLADHDLLHLFEIKLIVSPNPQLPSLPSENTVNAGNPFVPIYEGGYEGGIEGDLYMPQQMPQSSASNRPAWPFYMSDNEYMMEYSLGNPVSSK